MVAIYTAYLGDLCGVGAHLHVAHWRSTRRHADLHEVPPPFAEPTRRRRHRTRRKPFANFFLGVNPSETFLLPKPRHATRRIPFRRFFSVPTRRVPSLRGYIYTYTYFGCEPRRKPFLSIYF